MGDDSANDNKGSGKLPLAGTFKLRFPNFELLAKHLSRHISDVGIFIPTQNVKPSGTLLGLEIGLENGETFLSGDGEVAWLREKPTSDGPAGMAIRFVNLDEAGQAFVNKVAEMNRDAGIKPVVTEENVSQDVEEVETENSLDLFGPSSGNDPIIGIDFGTCNSCVAFPDNGAAKLVPSERGGLIIPTVVAVNDKGKTLIGVAAKEQLLINPTQTVYGVKRFLGRNYHSPYVREHAPNFPYELAVNEENEVVINLGGEDLTLPEIASKVFANLKENAEGYFQRAVKRAIVTVPAYYSESQRAAIKKSAGLAGLKVELMINEPTAASLAYGYDKEFEKRILIFDLGGGTFDVSILEVSANVFEVKGTGGDPFLGGMDFDKRIVDYIVENFKKEQKIDLRDDQVALQRITNAAENAKIKLSFEEESEIQLPFLLEKKGKPIDLKMPLTREIIEDLTKDLVEKTISICGSVVHSMGLMPSDIDDVLLVGGQTRMPIIQQKVEDYFGRPPSKGVHPDEAVALGAAVLAGSIGSITGPVLFDILSLPIGFGSEGGAFTTIFAKHSELPVTKKMKFNELAVSGANKILSLYQGESDDIGENQYIGEIKMLFPTINGAPEEIEIEFTLSREGILKVQAKHLPTDKIEKLSMQLVSKPESSPAPRKKADKPPPVETPAAQAKPGKEKKGIFKKLFS